MDDADSSAARSSGPRLARERGGRPGGARAVELERRHAVPRRATRAWRAPDRVAPFELDCTGDRDCLPRATTPTSSRGAELVKVRNRELVKKKRDRASNSKRRAPCLHEDES